MRLRLESLDRASMFRGIAMSGGPMSPEHLHEWGELLRQAVAEWRGAAALFESAPPAKGSSAFYRAEDALDEMSGRLSEDIGAWQLRYNAALDGVTSDTRELRAFTEQILLVTSSLKEVKQRAGQSEVDRLNAEAAVIVARSKETETAACRRFDALRGRNRRTQ